MPGGQGYKTVKGTQSDQNYVSRLLLDCVPVFHNIITPAGRPKNYSYATFLFISCATCCWRMVSARDGNNSHSDTENVPRRQHVHGDVRHFLGENQEFLDVVCFLCDPGIIDFAAPHTLNAKTSGTSLKNRRKSRQTDRQHI